MNGSSRARTVRTVDRGHVAAKAIDREARRLLDLKSARREPDSLRKPAKMRVPDGGGVIREVRDQRLHDADRDGPPPVSDFASRLLVAALVQRQLFEHCRGPQSLVGVEERGVQQVVPSASFRGTIPKDGEVFVITQLAVYPRGVYIPAKLRRLRAV